MLAELAPSEGCEGEPGSCLSPQLWRLAGKLVFFGFCCITLTSTFVPTWCPPSVRVRVQISPLYEDTSPIGFGQHPRSA